MHLIQGESCNINDTMGCLWNLNSNEIFFTKNGELCYDVNTSELIKIKKDKKKFSNFLPSITTSHVDNVHFKVNLGENVILKPFKYSKFNIFSIENCFKELKNEQFLDVIFIF